MAFFLSFELTAQLTDGRLVTIAVHDHYIHDGDLDDDGNLLMDELVFNYRVFDIEEDAEITQLSQEDQALIHAAILKDLESICQ